MYGISFQYLFTFFGIRGDCIVLFSRHVRAVTSDVHLFVRLPLSYFLRLRF